MLPGGWKTVKPLPEKMLVNGWNVYTTKVLRRMPSILRHPLTRPDNRGGWTGRRFRTGPSG